jgi:phosphoesterase RecJ-like protein
MQRFKEIVDIICKAKSILICGHINPDGDSLGSVLSLGLGLEKLGKRVYMLGHDDIPPAFKSLPGVNRLLKRIKSEIDLAIAVDCSTEQVLGRNLPIFKKAKSILEIDHHEFRRPFGHIQLIDYKACAVGELVYFLLKALKISIDRDIAENILVSIIVETNSFKTKIRPRTFRICTELLSKGIDLASLTDRIYGSKTKESIALSRICLSRCKFLKDGRIIWSIIKRSDFLKTGGKDYDLDPVVNEMLLIKGVEIVILFREKSKRLLRVSLRSNSKINVAELAEKFGGGGHFDAAGCYISNNQRSVRELLLEAENLI